MCSSSPRASWGVELSGNEARLQFMQTSPVRLGGGAYSFVRKSLWEYFLAVHLLDLAEDVGTGDDGEAAVDAAVRAFGVHGAREQERQGFAEQAAARGADARGAAAGGWRDRGDCHCGGQHPEGLARGQAPAALQR